MGLGWERQMLSTWPSRRPCRRWYARSWGGGSMKCCGFLCDLPSLCMMLHWSQTLNPQFSCTVWNCSINTPYFTASACAQECAMQFYPWQIEVSCCFSPRSVRRLLDGFDLLSVWWRINLPVSSGLTDIAATDKKCGDNILGAWSTSSSQ